MHNIKKNHHSTKAHKHTAKDLLNMTKLESRKERERDYACQHGQRTLRMYFVNNSGT